MKTIKMLALAAAATMSLAAPAMAATITYTYTSTFTGTNNGNPFTIGATFTGVGDTNNPSNIFLSPSIAAITLDSFTAVADGPYVVTAPTFSFFSNPQHGVVGFSADGFTGFSFQSDNLLGYDAVSNISTLTSAFFTNVVFTTDRGVITLTGQSDGSFSAVVGGTVPEPATWAMMIGGIGMVGGAMRRRKVRTKVSFA